jgi:hypothetical protein
MMSHNIKAISTAKKNLNGFKTLKHKVGTGEFIARIHPISLISKHKLGNYNKPNHLGIFSHSITN